MQQPPSLRSGPIAAFLEGLAAAGRSAATLRAYGFELRALDAAFPTTADADLRPPDLRRAVAQLSRDGMAPRSQRRRLAAWRQYLDWATGANPAKGIRTPKPAQRLPKALTVESALGLLDAGGPRPPAAAPVGWMESRDQALLELLYGAGIRLSEAVGLDLPGHAQSHGWISLERAELLVLGKGGKERLLPLGSKAIEAVERYLPQRAEHLRGLGQDPTQVPALFINRRGGRLSGRGVERRVAAAAVRAGLEQPLHPHMLRHSYASHLLQSSGDLRAVQELLGHAQLSTTEVYTQLDFQRLASVYDVAHPRARRGPDKASQPGPNPPPSNDDPSP